jgi:hypothetical protein
VPAPDNPVIVDRNRAEIGKLGADYAADHGQSATPIVPGFTPDQDAEARALVDNLSRAQDALNNLPPNPDPVAQGRAIADVNHAKYLIGQFAQDNPPPPDGPTMRAWTPEDQQRQDDSEAQARQTERRSALYDGWNALLAPLGIEIQNPYEGVRPYDPSRQHDLEQEGPPPARPY